MDMISFFSRSLSSGEKLVSGLTTNDSVNNSNNIVNGLELFVKYLIWVYDSKFHHFYSNWFVFNF